MSARVACTMALLVGACAGDPGWDRRVVGIEATLERALAAGAMRCAPRELALARAHLDFARFERERGHDARAHEHLAIAEPNAGAAEFLSPAEHCGGAVATAAAGALEGAVVDDPAPLAPPADAPADVPVDPERAQDVTLDAAPPADAAAPADTEPAETDPVDAAPEAALPVDAPEPEPTAARDSDGDGVRDVVDECPQVAGEAGAACPQSYEGLVVRAHRVVLLRPLELDADGVPSASTSALLAALAEALRDRPAMRVEIGAHTDSEGGELENLAESQRRAERVRALLVELGVDPARVRARGYGEELPLESNTTPEGRAANRRVEVVRIEAGEGAL